MLASLYRPGDIDYRGDFNIFFAAPLPSCMDSISAEHVTTVILYTVKRLAIFPSPAGMSLTIINLFPAKESLVSDIPAGEGKIVNCYYSVYPENASYKRKFRWDRLQSHI